MKNGNGLIVASFGRHYKVETGDGRCITAFPLGKKSPYACGDSVAFEYAAVDQARILSHAPRDALLYRSDQYRQKLIAANTTQMVLVAATEPAFSDELIARALVAAECERQEIVILLNKCDLTDLLEGARSQLCYLAQMGYRILELSAKHDVTALRHALSGKLSILVGQSGMGKSTLVNALLPDARATTREISTALDSGKHTTTHARCYRLDDGSRLIDSPGLQEFGLAHLTRARIEWGFREFRPLQGKCRFRDCRHDAEPDCAVKTAVASGTISARRLELFRKIVSECR